MGSFTSVINLRSTLSSRWRHTSYDFSSRSKKLFSWSQVKISARVLSNKRIFKLGVYFNQFVFSFSVSCYFLDTQFDRKFSRFSTKIPQITKNLVVFFQPNNLKDSKQHLHSKKIIGKFIFYSVSRTYRKFRNLNFFTVVDTNCFLISYYNFKVITTIITNFDLIFFESANLARKLLEVEKKINFRNFTKNIRDESFSSFKRLNLKNSATPLFSSIISATNSLVNLDVNFEKMKEWLAILNKNALFKSFYSSKLNFEEIQNQLVTSISNIFFIFSTYYFRVNPLQFLKIFIKIKKFMLTFSRNINVNDYNEIKFRWLKASYKNICNWVLKEFYLSTRAPIFNFIKKKFHASYLNKSGLFNTLANSTSLFFENLSNYSSLPATLISSIFAKRLQNRERVNPVLYSLMRLVLNRKKVLGLVIYRGGRFTKKQRTLRNTLKFGRVSFNSYVMPIDYGFSTAILKYSIVSIKIWISTPPPVNFFLHGLELSSNFTYPSVFTTFKIQKYFYLQKIFKLADAMEFVWFNSKSYTHSRISFMSSFTFISGWNFKHFKAYRQFAKFYLFSKSKYFSKIQKLLL